MPLIINPNAIERAPGFPPPFASAPAPTALALYNQIPPAVQFNLYRAICEGIRHEENTYGYFNSAFGSIFPLTQQFQINPQYPARPSVEVGAGRHGRNVSVGSTGEIHAGRGTGREQVKYPDFTITKPLPRQPPTPRIHCNVGVIEIKTLAYSEQKNVENRKVLVDEALLQTIEYAERLSTSPFSQREPNSLLITTYVVYGKYFTRITMTNHPNLGVVWRAEPWQFVFEEFSLAQGRAPFLYRLCEIAVRHWHYNG